MSSLVLTRASTSRSPGEWNDDDFDVLADGVVVAHHEGRGRRAAGQRGGVMSESLGLTSHKSSCNCTGCGLLRVGVCINCAEKIAALILESGPGELAAEPCSGACREAIGLYFSTPLERWRAPRAL